MISVLATFSVYSFVFMVYLFFSVEFYQQRLILKNNEVISDGALYEME